MPAKTILTPANIRFINKNRNKMCGTDMARRFGVSKSVVHRYMHKQRLSVSKKLQQKFRSQGMIGRTTFSKKEDKIIRRDYLTVPIKSIAADIGRSFNGVMGRLKAMGLKIPKMIREQRRQIGMYRKGSIPVNKGKRLEEFMSAEAIERSKKGRFKKGERSHNEKQDGAISIRHSSPAKGGHPHKYIRLSKGVWKELQIHNWEKKNGPIPKGHVLACKDGDTLNCSPSNWKIISKADNARRNAPHKTLPDNYVAHLLAGRKKKHLQAAFLKHPDLLELKRQQLIFNRTINEQRRNGTPDKGNS